jgi:hypothetical protein
MLASTESFLMQRAEVEEATVAAVAVAAMVATVEVAAMVATDEVAEATVVAAATDVADTNLSCCYQ